MSSRIQSKPRESRFRPNNSNVNASRGPASSIAIPSNDKSSSVKENKGNNEAVSNSNEDGIHNIASSPPTSTPVKTPLKQSGTPIGIPTPISIPTNTPKPLPKRTTPGPSSRTSVGPSSSLTQSTSSPGSRVRSFATPIPNQRQSETSSSNTNEITTAINIPTSLLRKTPTPSSRGVQSKQGGSSSSANATASVKGNGSTTTSTSTNSLGKRRMSLQGNGKQRIPPRGSKPSKPASAFTLFARQRRPEVEKYAASASGPKFDVNARVKSNWNSLSKDERIPFEKESLKLKQEYDLAMEAFKEIYGEKESDVESSEGEDETIPANKKIKRSLSVSSSSIKPTMHLSGSNPAPEKSAPPAQPPNSYFLFKNDFLQRVQENGEQIPNSGTISTAWQKLKESELVAYRKKAEDLRREWLIEMEEWKRNNSDDEDEDDSEEDEDGNIKKKRGKNGKSKRPKNPTISDDEAEYLAEKDSQKASNQQPKKLDNRLTAMSELSELRFTNGRASSKTFELERKLRDEKRERSKIRKQMRIHNVRTEDELMELMGAKKKEDQQQDQTNTFEQISLKRNLSEPPSDAESMVNDGHTTATEGEDDGQSDVESIGAASTSTHHTLRDKKFSIRTRIVDGKIVLDESSLQQARNNDAGYNDTAEMIDINESDRFVNSSTHSKRRQRNDRWSSEETEKFLQFVSMWGSDFEMIARMFPHRNRLQIKSKWRSMERTNSHSLDLAFKRRLPVDLNEYARITGVDLSGEVPQIESLQTQFNIKKAENEDEMDDDLVNAHLKGIDNDIPSLPPPPPPKKAEPELDENGLEIVEEGDDLDLTTVPSTAKMPRLTRSRVNRNKPDNPNMPPPSSTHRNLEDQSIPPPSTTTTTKTRRGRSSSLASQTGANSVYSATTTAGGSNLLHGASSAAASDRERKQRKIREEERRQRERARRRPIPSGEEEIVDQ